METFSIERLVLLVGQGIYQDNVLSHFRLVLSRRYIANLISLSGRKKRIQMAKLQLLKIAPRVTGLVFMPCRGVASGLGLDAGSERAVLYDPRRLFDPSGGPRSF